MPLLSFRNQCYAGVAIILSLKFSYVSNKGDSGHGDITIKIEVEKCHYQNLGSYTL